jgi:hypothetical protein
MFACLAENEIYIKKSVACDGLFCLAEGVGFEPMFARQKGERGEKADRKLIKRKRLRSTSSVSFHQKQKQPACCGLFLFLAE